MAETVKLKTKKSRVYLNVTIPPKGTQERQRFLMKKITNHDSEIAQVKKNMPLFHMYQML
jgi:hypothetical protein